jgi:hypothetical protein
MLDQRRCHPRASKVSLTRPMTTASKARLRLTGLKMSYESSVTTSIPRTARCGDKARSLANADLAEAMA